MAGNYERSEPEEATDELARFKKWYREDMRKVNAWRKAAKEDFQFRDGDQWSREDQQVLEEQNRPVITFNQTGVLVDAVVGAESNNRREVRYVPRENSDGLANELLTSSAEWFRDLCDAEDEESAAFKDVVTAGMGWTETRLDRTSNPEGDPVIEQIDPFEMAWSCNAVKPNLVDSKRFWRHRKIDIAEAMKMFPEADPEELDAAWADEDSDNDPSRSSPRDAYTREAKNKDTVSRKVNALACQYVEEETYYKALIITPPAMEPVVVDLDEAKFKIAQKQGAVLQSAKLKRETVMQCFLGNSTLLKKPMPTPTKTFTWSCITGLQDKDKGTFYGIVRRAKDPQRWANKWLSQNLHILNSQSKGGIIAERDAFEDEREAEASWARTDRITWVEKGALTANKIQPKPMAQFPAGFDRLMQYAADMIVRATGINMELLGMREVNQPGVLEYQRKQSGMGILASFFDSLRRYRKIQGRTMLKLIQEHLADGRMVRIVGEEKAEYVPLTKEAIANIEYDIVVDDAPSSTNEKEKTWQVVQAMLPLIKDQLGPAEMLAIAEYSPLPASLVEKLKKAAAAKAEQGPPPEQQAMMQMEQAKMQLEADKIAVDMQKVEADKLKAAADYEIAIVQAGVEKQKMETELIKAKAADLDAISKANDDRSSQLDERDAKGGSELAQALQVLMQMAEQNNAKDADKPKAWQIVRDPATGKALGMEAVH